MQVPPGADGPYLIALALIYGAVEGTKFFAHKKNGALPRMTEQLTLMNANLTVLAGKLSDIVHENEIVDRNVKENRAHIMGALNRIEGKLEKGATT